MNGHVNRFFKESTMYVDIYFECFYEGISCYGYFIANTAMLHEPALLLIK